MFLFEHWGLPVFVVGPVVLTIGVYVIGFRRLFPVRKARSGAEAANFERQAVAFAVSMASLVVALCSPIDYWSQQYFWVHMVQHLVLILLVAPMFVVSSPWLVLERGLPLGLRRRVSRAVVLGTRGMRRGRLWRALTGPTAATVALSGSLWAWHMPVLYDLTLSNQVVHDAEHASFVVFGVWFWAQLIESHPFKPRLEPLYRLIPALACATSMWILAMVLAFSNHPWYHPYVVDAQTRLLSALGDQQLGAAIMWVIPMVPFGVVITANLNTWLRREEDVDSEFEAMVKKMWAEGSAERAEARAAAARAQVRGSVEDQPFEEGQ
ncbi:MAG: cytochrome c oxidase assembly protein [Acidimicrobiales bacterium]